jgi:hypothetical protein
MQKSHKRSHSELLTHSFFGDSGRVRHPLGTRSALKALEKI